MLEAVERHIHSQTPAALRQYLEGCSWLVRLLPELGEQDWLRCRNARCRPNRNAVSCSAR